MAGLDLNAVMKDWTGPISLAGLAIYAVLVATGSGITDPKAKTIASLDDRLKRIEGLAPQVEQISDVIGALDGRLDDHDDRIGRVWGDARDARLTRTKIIERVAEAERLIDRLADRLDDVRLVMANQTQTLQGISDTSNAIQIALVRVETKLSEIDRRTGGDGQFRSMGK